MAGTRFGQRKVWVAVILLSLVFLLSGCAMIERITHNPWLSFAFKVLNFAILLAIFIKVLRKPLGKFLKNRQAKIKQALEDAEKAKTEAEKKMEEYEKRLARIDGEIEEIHRTLKEEGEREKARIVQEADQMTAKIREQAKAMADQEIRVARQTLREEMADLAVKLAEEILKKGMSEADQKKLVKEYVDQMESLS
jgi:F-type H+-transporting ATPase subunit b